MLLGSPPRHDDDEPRTLILVSLFVVVVYYCISHMSIIISHLIFMNVASSIMGKGVTRNRGLATMVLTLDHLTGDKSKRWLLDAACLEDFFIVI